MGSIRVTVWNEFRHEKEVESIAKIYPQGIHGAICEGLELHGFTGVKSATLDADEHGLSDGVLAETDVLVWWGHKAHGEVDDAIVERVKARVLAGMGLIVLHSGHHSKIFRSLMGTSCSLRWREADENERIWVIEPGHPIARGLGPYIDIEECEMYGEHFDVPAPDTLVFLSWFKGGNVFRSGCCYHRGRGKIFYFRPGHETYPIYYMETVRQVIANAAQWAAPSGGPDYTYNEGAINEKVPLEDLGARSERQRVG